MHGRHNTAHRSSQLLGGRSPLGDGLRLQLPGVQLSGVELRGQAACVLDRSLAALLRLLQRGWQRRIRLTFDSFACWVVDGAGGRERGR